MKNFDVVVIGGGPGGYVAAIRARQFGKSVAVIEMDKLGGVCLNRGCIPTKALLKSAHAVHEIKDMKALGVNVELQSLDGATAVKRANKIADQVGKGVSFLMKKNEIEVLEGKATLTGANTMDVALNDGTTETVEAKNIIIATGAKYKTFPGLEHDGERLIGAYEALKMEELPESIGIIGAGAIGMEFAYFWNAFGVKVHIFEVMDHLLPNEDEDSSLEIERAYKRKKVKFSLKVENLQVNNTGENVQIKATEKGE
jgi:dihydrolipoamide dehydrogenase